MTAWFRIGDKPLCEPMLTRFTDAYRYTVTLRGNPPVNGGFPSQRASDAESVSMSWNHQAITLERRHNGLESVSNHQPHDCFLNRLFRRRSKKTSKLRVTGPCEGNSPGTGEFPHKWPVTRKCFHLMTSSWEYVVHHSALVSHVV